nr:MAG TPA: hypothetical protein [Caudoviricetes sp.]
MAYTSPLWYLMYFFLISSPFLCGFDTMFFHFLPFGQSNLHE